MRLNVRSAARDLVRRAGISTRRIQTRDVADYVALFGEESVENRRFYNIAAGGHFNFGCDVHHPCWTNVDLDRPWKGVPFNRDGIEYDPKTDIAHDLLSLKPLPIGAASAELVHSRFSIEHITDEAADVMFHEVYRILKPGGVFRVVAPNMELDFRAYARRDHAYYSWADPGASLEQAFLSHFAANASTLHKDGAPSRISDDEFRHVLKTMSPEAALDYCVAKCDLDAHRRNRKDHINWWTPAKAERQLRLAGFETVYLSAAEQSAIPVLRNYAYFDNTFNSFMLYVEAVKGD